MQPKNQMAFLSALWLADINLRGAPLSLILVIRNMAENALSLLSMHNVYTPYNVGSVLRRLFSTEGYWIAFAVLMRSLRSTDAIPPQYLCYLPAVPNSLRSTEPTLCGVV